MTLNQPAPPEHSTRTSSSIMLLLVAIMLAAFGVTFLVVSLFYIRDLETLRTLPGLWWGFICGRVSDDSAILPLLLTIGTLALIAAAGAWGYRGWASRK